ncbi:MAG: hypothetical protein DI570_11865 [Phenylobacterium zucineum]|nr:MAG: hypothetical protein DI570_11865 [Phenylobacterium zucineum]
MSGTSSPVSAFVTINGHAFSFVDSIVFGRSQTSSAADQADMLNSISYQAHGVGSIDIVALASGSGSPATLGQSYAMSAFDGAPIAILVGALYDQAFFVQMDVASAYGGVVAAVPEPATWALMITGFGLAGATLRRWTGLQPT